MEKDVTWNIKTARSRVTVLISDKKNFNARSITREHVYCLIIELQDTSNLTAKCLPKGILYNMPIQIMYKNAYISFIH